MTDTPRAEPPARLHLTLQRRAGTPGWQVELHDPGAPRRFESLTELMTWLRAFDPPPKPPARGIR